MEEKEQKNICTGSDCPPEEHGNHKGEEGGTCPKCGHGHKEGTTCPECGCA